jgi:hypothetical protein
LRSGKYLIHIGQRLYEIGFGAIKEIGLPEQPLLNIHVSHGWR